MLRRAVDPHAHRFGFGEAVPDRIETGNGFYAIQGTVWFQVLGYASQTHVGAQGHPFGGFGGATANRKALRIDILQPGLSQDPRHVGGFLMIRSM